MHFLPWVGTEYPTGGIFGKRIMVMGESHYCDDCDDEEDYSRASDFTTRVVNDYIDFREGTGQRQKWMPTFARFENALAGHETEGSESRRIWQSLMFYNYIQVYMPASNSQPSKEQYRAAAEPFFEVLSHYKPDLLIAWGKSNLFFNTPGEHWQLGQDIGYEGETGKSGVYQTKNGKGVKTLFIRHPAGRFSSFSWEKWHEIIKQFADQKL